MHTNDLTQNITRRLLLKSSGLGAIAGYAGAHLPAQAAASVDEPIATDGARTETERALIELENTVSEYAKSYLQRGSQEPSSTDIAEGYRYLLHLINVGTELFFEGNPSHPEMTQMVTPTRKLMGDNADAYYFHALIAADGSYRVRGRSTGEVYISLTLHTGDAPGGWASGVAGTLNSKQFSIDENGHWEVLLGKNVSGPNSIQTTPDTVSVISRHYYLNKTYAAADPDLHPYIRVERLDAVPPPDLPTDQEMARKYRALDRFIRANSIDRPLTDPNATPEYFSLIPNTIGQPQKSIGSGWTSVDNAKAAGFFFLQPDEALIVKGRMPECLFSNVILWNKYLQSFDYRYRQVSLNKAQMELADDGSFTIVIAHRDPGVANWLDTEGRQSGIVYWRFMLPTEEIEPLVTLVVPFAKVPSNL